jgi:hypothetical protein
VLVSEDSFNQRNHFYFIGNHQGEILVFNIPQKGTNITLKETIRGKN